jgi:chitin synthase
MIMALLEWFLWLAAFVYCLYKAFRKAEHWSINVLCVVVGILFVAFRFVRFLYTSYISQPKLCG